MDLTKTVDFPAQLNANMKIVTRGNNPQLLYITIQGKDGEATYCIHVNELTSAIKLLTE